jgi:hypothetical protein
MIINAKAMKTKIYLSPAVLTLRIACIAVVMLFSTWAVAQPVSMCYNGQEITVVKDTLAQLTTFTGKHIEGKTYLHWNVTEQKCSGIYIIYRSWDGLTFEVLGHKAGIGVPIKAPISYYFEDEKPALGLTYYKVVHISENKTYLVSSVLSIQGEEILFTGTK